MENIIAKNYDLEQALKSKLKKPDSYLQGYLRFSIGCNDRYLNCCADVDISSLSHDKTDFHSKPVLDKNKQKIAVIDLRKDRQVILLKELLKPKYAVFGFKTAELQSRLESEFSNSAKIRYELKKLIARGVVSKKRSIFLYSCQNRDKVDMGVSLFFNASSKSIDIKELQKGLVLFIITAIQN